MTVDSVHKLLAERFALTDVDRSATRGGQRLWKNEIRWARQDLIEEGMLAGTETAGRGHWVLVAAIFREATDRADELLAERTFVEGAATTVLVNRYERNRSARNRCLAVHGTTCVVCGFSFEREFWTPAGVGPHIHVHHLVPLASIGARYKLDPIRHLVPICPNCHHMIHRREPPFSVDELKAIRKLASDHWGSSKQ